MEVAEKGFEATIPYFVICELLRSTASPSTSHSDGEHDMGMLYEPTALDPALAGEIIESFFEEVMPERILKKLARHRESMYGWWSRQRAACQRQEGERM